MSRRDPGVQGGPRCLGGPRCPGAPSGVPDVQWVQASEGPRCPGAPSGIPGVRGVPVVQEGPRCPGTSQVSREDPGVWGGPRCPGAPSGIPGVRGVPVVQEGPRRPGTSQVSREDPGVWGGPRCPGAPSGVPGVQWAQASEGPRCPGGPMGGPRCPGGPRCLRDPGVRVSPWGDPGVRGSPRCPGRTQVSGGGPGVRAPPQGSQVSRGPQMSRRNPGVQGGPRYLEGAQASGCPLRGPRCPVGPGVRGTQVSGCPHGGSQMSRRDPGVRGGPRRPGAPSGGPRCPRGPGVRGRPRCPGRSQVSGEVPSIRMPPPGGPGVRGTQASGCPQEELPALAAPRPQPGLSFLVPEPEDLEDLYSRYKKLQQELEFLEVQEEYIKDEQKNLKKEFLHAQEEVKRIQSIPLVIGQFLEAVDQNTAIVGSTTGSNYYVRILSTIDRELLKPNASVALHKHSNALVDVLPPEADSSIMMLTSDQKPDVMYADIGGMDIQKQEVREAVELPLTHFELYKQIGIDPPRGVLMYGPPGCGKTMLAKAVAHHTTAAFIRVVGSEFVQKYLGEGPRMVRDVFRLAKENAPAIIFIDEIDAIATKRFDAQTGGDHGDEPGGHPGPGAAASRPPRPQDRVPAARPAPEASHLLHHHRQDEPLRGGRPRGLRGPAGQDLGGRHQLHLPGGG
uniref:Proteasome 26S subunit, ATPase 4 n=1 Tax=Apteryx owenii TaxID=8824 RepID=A0A8B9P4M2_APTOW